MTDPTVDAHEVHEAVTLDIEPLDVLFFRDGRPFDAAPRATGGLPTPQTLAGALRTWLFVRLGGDVGALAADVRKGVSFADAAAGQGTGPAAVGRLGIRGPWFAMDGERLVSTPATIERDCNGGLHRLDPLGDVLPGWRRPDGLRPLWRRSRGSAKPRGGYLRASGLRRFVDGTIPRDDDIVDADALFAYEDRVGINVDARTGTVGDEMIYAVRMMRLRPGVTLSVDLVGAPGDLDRCPAGDDILALGGESRRVIVRRAASAWRWPTGTAEQGTGRLVLLTTPAPIGGWRPPELPLLAAAVPGYVPVSGWDLARGGPKPNRFAVAAGSVYFMDPAADLCALPGRRGSLCTGENAALGWGAYIEGIWNHA